MSTQADELINEYWPDHLECRDLHPQSWARQFEEEGVVCGCGTILGWPSEPAEGPEEGDEEVNPIPTQGMSSSAPDDELTAEEQEALRAAGLSIEPHAVGDTVTVAGVQFTKHSDSPFEDPDGHLFDPQGAAEASTAPDDGAWGNAGDGDSGGLPPWEIPERPGPVKMDSSHSPSDWVPDAEQRQAAGEPTDIAALAEGEGYDTAGPVAHRGSVIDTPVEAKDPINAALAAIDPTKIYTPVDVEMQLVDLERRLEQGQVFQRVWENRAYEAGVTFELAWARAIVKASGGAADMRKAQATIECEEQLVEKMQAEHMVKAVRETMHNLRSMLSGYQSIASSIRASMSVAGAGRT